LTRRAPISLVRPQKQTRSNTNKKAVSRKLDSFFYIIKFLFSDDLRAILVWGFDLDNLAVNLMPGLLKNGAHFVAAIFSF
jgi:hypothetical protein